MDIRFLRQYGLNHAPGQVVRGFPGGAAAELIRTGVAVAVDAAGEKVSTKLDGEAERLGRVPPRARGRK